jgi:hypothetical protein
MGRIYYAVFEEVAVTAVQDLFELVAPADSSVEVHMWGISQSSDAGDSESEQLNVLVHRGTATGSGGSSVTPEPRSEGDAAFGGTVEANNTTQSVEAEFIGAHNFNIMAGIDVVYPPELRPIVSPSQLFIVELQTTPADSLTMSGYLYFEEIGG